MLSNGENKQRRYNRAGVLAAVVLALCGATTLAAFLPATAAATEACPNAAFRTGPRRSCPTAARTSWSHHHSRTPVTSTGKKAILTGPRA